jgi:hypothetical protein
MTDKRGETAGIMSGYSKILTFFRNFKIIPIE